MLSAEDYEFRQKCKFAALNAASSGRPPMSYDNYTQQAIGKHSYDLLKEAEKIYQWLIKEDVAV